MDSNEKNYNEGFEDSLLLKVLQTSNEATAVYSNDDLKIRFANDAMLKLWGKDKSVIGKNLADALPELQGQPFIELLQKVWYTGITYAAFDTPADLEINGKLDTFYFDFEYRAIQNDSNKTWCIIHSAKDVTQRRAHLLRLEEKEEEEQALNEEMAATLEELLSTNEELNQSLVMLADSRAHVRTIIEQAPIGICMLQGPDLKIEIANAEILRIWGRKEAEVLGKSHELARPELKNQPINAWLKEVFETGKNKVNNEFKVTLYHNGGLRDAYVNSIYQPIRSSKGEITGVLIILEEITDQLRRRLEHEKSQQMFAIAVEAGGLATFFYDPKANLFSGNETLKKWFGLSPEENIDLSNAITAILEEDRQKVTTAIADALTPGADGNYSVEYRISAPNSPVRSVLAIGKTTYDEQGNPASLNGTIRDITEQKKDDQRKDDFISMVSHELKTPLTSLNGYIQLMQRKAKQTDDLVLLNMLNKSAKQIGSMGAMIHGFLNVSRLESGKLAIDARRFDMLALFDELNEDLNTAIDTHEIQINATESLVLNADREKIIQVIHNLVGNATKYAPSGSLINLGYQQQGDKVYISVQDQGPGIAEEDREQIFERYYRVKNKDTGSISGFGIGLYLCKEIVERHGGNIFLAKSEIGAKFTFTLPIT